MGYGKESDQHIFKCSGQSSWFTIRLLYPNYSYWKLHLSRLSQYVLKSTALGGRECHETSSSCKSWHGHLLPYFPGLFPWLLEPTSVNGGNNTDFTVRLKTGLHSWRCSVNLNPFPLLECSDIMTVHEHDRFDPCFLGPHLFAYCWFGGISLALFSSLSRSWNPHLLWKLVGAELEANPLGMEKEQLCILRFAADGLCCSPHPYLATS